MTKLSMSKPNQNHTFYKFYLDHKYIGLVMRESNTFHFEPDAMNPHPGLNAFDRRTMKEIKEQLEALTKMDPEHQVWMKLFDLVSELSPENLTCDGELCGTRLVAKRQYLLNEWARCEKTLGRKVTEDEVWTKWQEVYKSAA